MSNRKQQSRGSSDSNQQTRRQQIAQQRRQQQLKSFGLMAIGALIILSILILPGLNNSGGTSDGASGQPVVDSPPREHPQADDNALGDPAAPVVIMEFSDFQCSHCRNFFADTEQLLINAYVTTGQVYFIYRSFGQNFESGKAAEAAYCAGDQDNFWEMHDIIFTNYGTPPTDDRLVEMASVIGLDMETFEKCFSDRKYRDRVAEDLEDGSAAGIEGTPSFLINGELQIVGNEPWSSFQAKIEAALAAAGN